MIINREKFAAADITFSTFFNKVFTAMRERLAIGPLTLEVASSTRQEMYVWANAFPKFIEWVSDAQFSRMSAYGYAIENKYFQGGLEVLREDIEDDNLNVVRPQIANLAEEAAFHEEDLIFSLMVNGFTNLKGLAYDGQFFYDTDHQDIGGGPIQSNKATYKLSQNSLQTAITMMRSLKDVNGRYLRIEPTDIYVSPSNEWLARQLVYQDYILVGAVLQPNPLKGIVKVNVWNRLASVPDAWFLFDQSKEGIKPFVHQTREPMQFVAQDRPEDDNNFMRRILRWSAFCRDNAGYGMWQSAWASDGSTAPLLAEAEKGPAPQPPATPSKAAA